MLIIAYRLYVFKFRSTHDDDDDDDDDRNHDNESQKGLYFQSMITKVMLLLNSG